MFIIDSVFYAPANIAKVFLTTQTNTSSFHFTWQYTDVTNFGQIQHSTGSIIPLNLTQNTNYRFNSPKNQVVFHTGSIIGDNDRSRYRIYVYDGENLNAKFLGNLVVFTDNSQGAVPVFVHPPSPSGKEVGMTVYCLDCQESYINNIRFLNPNVTGQEVRVKPMGPSDGIQKHNSQLYSLQI
ncbi:hypothetical protein CRE_05404 [Caenorhabditis remanei]|uniref:CUB-like domain-containing protein n=1 Tax=Caenorhabditis remanei TaxID=31234 RepID=E3M0D9_CAERE|nr:hypothetical protein CRE_05404 [Caenorhabditis remanei]